MKKKLANKKKAIEIAKTIIPDFLCEEGGLGEEKLAQNCCVEAALQMAEWKDQQTEKSYNKGLDMGKSIAKQEFKECLKKKQKEFTDEEAGYYVIKDIINRVFGKE